VHLQAFVADAFAGPRSTQAKNALADVFEELGRPERVRRVFIDFQKYLYSNWPLHRTCKFRTAFDSIGTAPRHINNMHQKPADGEMVLQGK
jgi:hypothetical protein